MEDWIKELAQKTFDKDMTGMFEGLEETKVSTSDTVFTPVPTNLKMEDDLDKQRLLNAITRLYSKLESSVKSYNSYCSTKKQIKLAYLSTINPERGFILVQGGSILRIDHNVNCGTLDIYAIYKNTYQVSSKKVSSYIPKQDPVGKPLWINGTTAISEEVLLKIMFQTLSSVSGLNNRAGATAIKE